MSVRWIAFRDLPGAPVGASLPIGLGWRGGVLRGAEALADVDRRVLDAAGKVQTAFALWGEGDVLYGVAAHGEKQPIRFALNVDERAEGWQAIRDACSVGPSPAAWRQRTALDLADWTAHTPRASDPLEIDAILQVTGEAEAIVASWFELLGLAVPVDRAENPVDEAARKRAELAQAAERRRQRRIAAPTPAW